MVGRSVIVETRAARFCRLLAVHRLDHTRRAEGDLVGLAAAVTAGSIRLKAFASPPLVEPAGWMRLLAERASAFAAHVLGCHAPRVLFYKATCDLPFGGYVDRARRSTILLCDALSDADLVRAALHESAHLSLGPDEDAVCAAEARLLKAYRAQCGGRPMIHPGPVAVRRVAYATWRS